MKKKNNSHRFPALGAAHRAAFRTANLLLFGMNEKPGGALHAPPEVGVPRQCPVSQLVKEVKQHISVIKLYPAQRTKIRGVGVITTIKIKIFELPQVS